MRCSCQRIARTAQDTYPASLAIEATERSEGLRGALCSEHGHEQAEGREWRLPVEAERSAP
jgi:hypothetical protein